MKKSVIDKNKNLNLNEKILIKQIFEDHEKRRYETKKILAEYTNDYELFSFTIEGAYNAYEYSVGKNYSSNDEWLKLALIAIKEFYAANDPFPESIVKMSLFEFLSYCEKYVFNSN